MSYNLRIISHVDITLNATESVMLTFLPKTTTDRPLGMDLEVPPDMTLGQLRKFVASDLRLYYPSLAIDHAAIRLFYQNTQVPEGKVVASLAHIDAHYTKEAN
jgi:hypothetical protein